MAERTAGKQRGRPFRRGESGNPAGRPIGARHKATVAAEALLDGEAERLTRKVLEMALAGDIVAMRLCLERILPPRRERPVRFKLPEFAIATRCSRRNGRASCRSCRWRPNSKRSGRVVEIGGRLREGAGGKRFRSAASRYRGEGRCDETLSVASSASRVPVLDRRPLKYGSLTAMGHSVVPWRARDA